MAKNLSKEELEFIKQREVAIANDIAKLNYIQKFKLGDYLIAFRNYDFYRRKYGLPPPENGTVEPIINSYGAPRKYKVVHIDINYIPYIKELNKKNNPIGRLICPVMLGRRDDENYEEAIIFEVDPDYMDSVIMMDEENYDSAIIHKSKSDLHKEITEYNKQHKINCHKPKLLAEYFDKNVTIGTTLHRSMKSFFTIIEIKTVPVDSVNRVKKQDLFCKVQTSKGEVKFLCIQDLLWKALYTQRPRSYNELKDLK